MKLTKEIHLTQTKKIMYTQSQAHVCTNETKDDKGRYVYDCIWVPVTAYTEAAATEGLKKMLKEQIEKYDCSDDVNGFSINGTQLWLDKAERTGLYLRFLSEQANGNTTTTLWKGTASFTLNIEDAIKMLGKLEVYASACYDATHKHLAEVEELTDMDAILAYDFTTGYPAKLTFGEATLAEGGEAQDSAETTADDTATTDADTTTSTTATTSTTSTTEESK